MILSIPRIMKYITLCLGWGFIHFGVMLLQGLFVITNFMIEKNEEDVKSKRPLAGAATFFLSLILVIAVLCCGVAYCIGWAILFFTAIWGLLHGSIPVPVAYVVATFGILHLWGFGAALMIKETDQVRFKKALE